MNTKYIFVTGGVVSSLGKGIISASIGKLLQARGFKVTDSFSIPVFAQVAANPSSQKAYLVLGLTLQP